MQRPHKRRKPPVPDSAGLDWARPSGDGLTPALSLTGLGCTLFEAAGDYDPEEHLIPWHGDAGTLVDRFDGRLLLDGLPARGADSWDQLPPEEVDCSPEELDAERFADLDPALESRLEHLAGWFDPEARAADGERPTPRRYSFQRSGPWHWRWPAVAADSDGSDGGREGGGGAFAAVGFSYGGGVEQGGEQPPAAEEAPFAPGFPLPEGLAVPETERQHKIMVQTARFVAGAGRQSVFVLRVKQAGNPHFAFLAPGDRLHAYFEWLLSADLDTLEAAQAAAGQPPGSPAAAGDALGLLSAYDEEPGPPPSPPRGPQPPAETAAIVGKLVRFVKERGAGFEASLRAREADNPRFAFLRPGHVHHAFYRQQLAGAIGERAAAATLPPLSPDQGGGEAEGAPAASAAAPQESPPARPSAPAALRANPRLVQVALRPLTRERATGQPGAEAATPPAEQPEQGAAPAAGAPADGEPAAGVPASAPAAGAGGAADELELLEAGAPGRQGEAAAATDEEERKARRRRLARQLLLSKQSRKAPPAEAAPPPASRITDHRSAFLAEEEGGERPAPEARPAPAAAPSGEAAQPSSQQLPQLDELLRAKRAQPAAVFSELEVLPPAQPAAGDGAGEEVGASGRRRERRKRRSRSRSSDDSGGSGSRRQRRRRRSGSRERRRKKDGKAKDGKARRRPASPKEAKAAPPPPLEAPEVLEARIRAMLRGL